MGRGGGSFCAPAFDENQPPAGTKSVSTALLHPWKETAIAFPWWLLHKPLAASLDPF